MNKFKFNKSLTKKLLEASSNLNQSSVHHLNFLLERKDTICGFKYKKLFKEKMFYITLNAKEKGKKEYRLTFGDLELPRTYLIPDIEDFVNYLSYDEFEVVEYIEGGKKEMFDILENVSLIPLNGFVTIDDDKIYIMDYIK